MKDGAFRINLGFEASIRRALETKPISDDELQRGIKKRKALAEVKRKPRRARRSVGR